MTHAEFTERTNFNPTDECYNEYIEPMYMNSTLEKDEWCKQFVRGGGIAEAYSWQVRHDTAKIGKINSMLEESGREMEMLQVFLIRQADKWSAPDLRDRAIAMMGEREYLEYKLKHNLKLWDADKEAIIKMMNK